LAKIEDKKEEADDLLAKCEKLSKDAISMITYLFTDSHPLAAKYNQIMVEVINLRPENPERTHTLIQICDKNLEIAQKFFG